MFSNVTMVHARAQRKHIEILRRELTRTVRSKSVNKTRGIEKAE